MDRFPMPKVSGKARIVKADRLTGVDFYHSPAQTEPCRSPDACNMIWDGAGGMRKRMGYYDMYPDDEGVLDGEIHRLMYRSETELIIHHGTKLFSTANGGWNYTLPDKRIDYFNYGGRLFLLTGERFLLADRSGITPLDARTSYLPTVAMNQPPHQRELTDNTRFEPLNMLCSSFAEGFAIREETTQVQLFMGGLTAIGSVYAYNSKGEATIYIEGTDFTADLVFGTLTFHKALPVVPASFGTNLTVVAGWDNTTEISKLNGCTVAEVFGEPGGQGRAFVGGNPQYPGRDWHCMQGDITYFPVNGESLLCGGRQVGYGVQNNRLFSFFTGVPEQPCILVREEKGSYGKTDNAFSIVDAVHCPDAISPYTIQSLNGELLFLTSRGVMALARENGYYLPVSRSGFIDASLTAQPGLEDAVSCVYQNRYYLAAGAYVYVLSGDHTYVPKDAGRSRRWYEAAVLNGFSATDMAAGPQGLIFGANQGTLFAFYQNADQSASYLDNGAPISCYWETPDFTAERIGAQTELTRFSVELGEENGHIRLLSGGRPIAEKKWKSRALTLKLRSGRFPRLRLRVEDRSGSGPFTLRKWEARLTR